MQTWILILHILIALLALTSLGFSIFVLIETKKTWHRFLASGYFKGSPQ